MRGAASSIGFALALGIGAVSMAVPAGAASHQDTGWCNTITLQWENDAVGGTDRNYTNGGRLACVRQAPDVVEGWLRSWVPKGAKSQQTASYAIGHNIYTPDDLAEPDLIEDDQPYAGWLYLDFGFDTEVTSAAGDMRYLDNIGLQLGVVGSIAGGEQLQTYLHEVLGATEPEGWDNQLDNEPGINLFYSRQWTGFQRYALPLGGGDDGIIFDATPKLGAALGNVFIHGAGGLTLRLGHFPPNDHGPPAIRPSFSGSDDFPKGQGWSAYVFGGVEGRVVGRNIFLDGNSFDSDSPSVDKNVLVGETRLGLAVTLGDIRLAYTHVFRSQEFEGQEPLTYGGLTLAFGL